MKLGGESSPFSYYLLNMDQFGNVATYGPRLTFTLRGRTLSTYGVGHASPLGRDPVQPSRCAVGGQGEAGTHPPHLSPPLPR